LDQTAEDGAPDRPSHPADTPSNHPTTALETTEGCPSNHPTTALETTEDWFLPIVDVSGMSLADLAAHADDSALAHCLRRLADGLADLGEPIAGFNSAL
jgi:FXSXX-COOH protein